MREIEHWFCPHCGEIDGPRAGMRCHGPGYTGGCTLMRNEVVEISHDAALRLQEAGETVPFRVAGEVRGTARIVSANVTDDGKALVLTCDVDAEIEDVRELLSPPMSVDFRTSP